MKKFCATLVLIITVLALVAGAYFVATRNTDYYVVDKGWMKSYQDEYGCYHDDVYWLVVDDGEQSYTIFTASMTWHHYSVGEAYFGTFERGLVYEGDDGIVRHINGGEE